MKSIYDFIIEPKNTRYNNTKKVGDKELVLNTEIFNHQYVSREAVIKHLPLAIETELQVGDEIIVHHNVFRRWHNVHGEEKNSRSFLDENTYCVREDQIFSYKRNNKWSAIKGFCFVKPIHQDSKFDIDKEKPLTGIMKLTNDELISYGINNGDLVGFLPNSEYEFVIDGERLYRVMTNFISIKYEYQGNEEEYNPSWASSS
jgi:hypothetical protein